MKEYNKPIIEDEEIIIEDIMNNGSNLTRDILTPDEVNPFDLE